MDKKAAALKIKGVKWFKDILNDNSRQFGLKVHKHLPQRTIQFEEFGNDSIIRRPEDNNLIVGLLGAYEVSEGHCFRGKITCLSPSF